MSLTISPSNAAVINIGGKTATTVDTLNYDATEKVASGSGLENGDKKSVGAAGVQGDSKTESTASTQSITVQMLLKRMKELQQQMREQQQQLAATQAARFANAEAKITAIVSIQQRITGTAAAISEVAAALAAELTKGAATGNLVSTSA
ncbi:hypothetical protein [Pseudomonas sp. TNT3]|uniref:hypothetical protein n=1 Tax=Pseudomonas sp. TNT3 TaxID=2654097 RepID=UPI0013913975|nr:hypothetical protein [Pseudomonas sp. TNT3]KAI2693062.1 hypothetical protein GBC55_007565 [Pseudomonas sp. TNT3]